MLCKRGNRGENKVDAVTVAAAVATATATIAAVEPALKHTPIACERENERCGWHSTTENRSSSGSTEVVAIEIAPIILKQNDCIIRKLSKETKYIQLDLKKKKI